MTRVRTLAILTALAGASISVPAEAGGQTITIGHSVRHRPITAQVLGPSSAPRKILLVGCIHGNECAGIRILNAIARQPVPPGVQLWLVREMNPDGTAADTRQNAHGVDLNRNFPYRWDTSPTPPTTRAPGLCQSPRVRRPQG